MGALLKEAREEFGDGALQVRFRLVQPRHHLLVRCQIVASTNRDIVAFQIVRPLQLQIVAPLHLQIVRSLQLQIVTSLHLQIKEFNSRDRSTTEPFSWTGPPASQRNPDVSHSVSPSLPLSIFKSFAGETRRHSLCF